MSRGDTSGCLSKQGVTVGSMGASGKPKQGVDASGTLNVRYSPQIRSLRTKLRVRVGSMDAPKKAKKRYAHQVCSLRTKQGVTVGSMDAPKKPKKGYGGGPETPVTPERPNAKTLNAVKR